MGNNSNKEHPDKYQEIVEGLRSNKFKNIMFITGAGISTAAGIPDFRSKEGCFAQIQKNIIYLIQSNYFKFLLLKKIQNPFMTFAKDLI